MSSTITGNKIQDITENLVITGKSEGILTISEIRQAVNGAGLRKEQMAIVMADLQNRGIRVMNETDPDESELRSIEHDELTESSLKEEARVLAEDRDHFEKTMSVGIPIDDPVRM